MKQPLRSSKQLLKERAHVQASIDDCMCNETKCHSESPNINCYTATIHLPEHPSIGSIVVQLLNKSRMVAVNPSRMWEECQAYDNSHGPGAKLDKVENYLSNECFSIDKQALIDEAETILFIEEVYVDPQYRGHGVSLLAVDSLIERLGLGENSIVLLQAAPLLTMSSDADSNKLDASRAHEKIACHWERMGFAEWSWTNGSWLCMSTKATERPSMHEILPELFVEPSANSCAASRRRMTEGFDGVSEREKIGQATDAVRPYSNW